MNRPICVIASYMRDLSIVVDRFPAPGETRVGGDSLEAHGGKGSNQAIQAARCGARVAVLAALGDDDAGRAAQQAWRDEQIDTTGVVSRPGAPTGRAVVLVSAQGQNQIVISPGANLLLGPADVERARAAIEASALVVSQLETPIEATLMAFRLARAAGRLTVLNTAPAPEALPDALWSLTDVLIANEVEAAMLSGVPIAARDDASLIAQARLAAERLLPRVGATVVITLGAAGAILLTKQGSALHAPALPVAAIDSTGAGDAFVGAFAHRLAAGGAPGQALLEGIAAGSLACTVRGVHAALHDRARIEDALTRHPPTLRPLETRP